MKSKVNIENHRGWLRLRWTYQSKRPTLSLGLPDSPVGRKVAMGRAAIIEADLATGNYDPTLRKYKPDGRQAEDEVSSLAVTELFERFVIYRSKGIIARTASKYSALSKRVKPFFEGMAVSAIDEEVADRFRLALDDLSPGSRREYLRLMSGCWTWGIKRSLVDDNPWGEVIKRVKVPPIQKVKPFSKIEVAKILKAFEESPDYSHHTDFVRFLFSTGCRLGEAIGLRWGHLTDDCSKAWIGESMSLGIRKATKTNTSREFKLSPNIQKMLLARRPEQCSAEDLVFPSARGMSIDTHNFKKRAWTQLLKQACIPYRKPYSTRHTFICHAMEAGLKPMAVAEMTGHNPETLFKHYAAYIPGLVEMPELF